MRNSIRKRTFRYLLSSMILLILVVSVVIFNYFNKQYREQYVSAQLFMTEKSGETVSDLIRSMKQDAYYLCCSEPLAEALVNDENLNLATQSRMIHEAFTMNTGTATTPLLRYATASLLIDTQFPCSRNWSKYFSFDTSQKQRIYSAASVCDEDWYRQAEAYNAEIYAFLSPQEPNCVFFARLQRNFYLNSPLYSDTVGVVLYAMPQISLSAMLMNDQMNESAISLMMFNGEPLACTSDSLLQEEDWDAAALMAILPEKNQTAGIRIGGRDYTVSSTNISQRWDVVILQPVLEPWYFMRDVLRLIAIFMLILVGLALVISIMFSRTLSHPIIELSNAMVNARKARAMPERIPVIKSSDEIEYLYHSYNDIVDNIHRISETERAQNAKLQATELKALQSQINPHFVYNTLDSVACIALMHGEEDIATMVASLIRILKYSIRFSDVQVELCEEVDYLQQYIQIQQMRYRDRFDFICDIPAQYDHVLVPKLMIQPLVENALFHAENQDHRLKIRVYCESDQDLFRIHVCDNGSGANAEQLNAWLRDGDGGEKFGIGIRNVNKRIQLMCSEEYGIRYSLLPDGGLDAMIVLPYKLTNPAE
ncbi:MAG: sensor histidine kinase [Aristaeellaceae bacterium]